VAGTQGAVAVWCDAGDFMKRAALCLVAAIGLAGCGRTPVEKPKVPDAALRQMIEGKALVALPEPKPVAYQVKLPRTKESLDAQVARIRDLAESVGGDGVRLDFETETASLVVRVPGPHAEDFYWRANGGALSGVAGEERVTFEIRIGP